MREASSIQDLLEIRSYGPNHRLLENISNLGTCLGFKKVTDQAVSNQPAIIVFVYEKINKKWLHPDEVVPGRLEIPRKVWCAVDVVEGGKAESEDFVEDDPGEIGQRLRGWDEQIWVGSQISTWIDPCKGLYESGTIGAFARRRVDGALGILTNQHVAKKIGQKLYFPVPWGVELGKTKEAADAVRDENWFGGLIDEPDALVKVDCAFVEINATVNHNDLNPEIMGFGPLSRTKRIPLNDMSIIGTNVFRIGRTTGLRKGTIVGYSYEYLDEPGESIYTDLLIRGDDGIPFSTKGDSGSLIVTDDGNMDPIGLMWGGWQEKLSNTAGQENWTYAVSLSRIEDYLGIDLVSNI